MERIKPQGKFFFTSNGDKFYLKGVTYGTFRSDESGFQYPSPSRVDQDLSLMQQSGVNCIRVYTTPPEWLLDKLADSGIRLLLGIAWPQYQAFLDSSHQSKKIRDIVAKEIQLLNRHPAIFGYMIGNEIPADIVRWHGKQKIERFLKDLYHIAKQSDPQGLVSYANYPTTEYLELGFLDYISFNVYLHNEADYRRYLYRLHNLANAKPLVLSEFGVDSLREGQDQQASFLTTMLRVGSELGAAGSIVFAWTDEWYRGGHDIDDWDFGLVTRDRSSKPALQAVANQFAKPGSPDLPNPPRVSVVVCAYNAARTMRQCLDSLERLSYPNYEVIVVNDGSTDETLEICKLFPYIRLVNQVNHGLSVARNIGMHAATGEIIAYTDSDCVADPDWLNYLVQTFEETGFCAVGGPNYPPPEKLLVPSVVAVSPGGPTHVLLDDHTAEHIAGCNMAFRKDLLMAIGGFDPQFRAAGDDVDICWRVQDSGHTIGFSPAAMVWHFRRNTVKDYFNQQRGYGKAEALVFQKHPDRFNRLGQARWSGRIYGDLTMAWLPQKPIIYSGVFGRAPFQSFYQTPLPFWSYIPFTLEWNVLSILLLVIVAPLRVNPLWVLTPFLITLGATVFTAAQIQIGPQHNRIKAFFLAAWLTHWGPIVRSLERYKWTLLLTGQSSRDLPEIQIKLKNFSPFKKSLHLSYWSSDGLARDSLLESLTATLKRRNFFVQVDSGWDNCDLTISQGLWASLRIISATEEHGSNQTLTRLRLQLIRTSSQIVSMVTLLSIVIFFWMFKLLSLALTMLVFTVIILIYIWIQKIRLLRRILVVVESLARSAGMDSID